MPREFAQDDSGIRCTEGPVKKACGLQPTGLSFLRPLRGLS